MGNGLGKKGPSSVPTKNPAAGRQVIFPAKLSMGDDTRLLQVGGRLHGLVYVGQRPGAGNGAQRGRGWGRRAGAAVAAHLPAAQAAASPSAPPQDRPGPAPPPAAAQRMDGFFFVVALTFRRCLVPPA